MLWSLRAWCNTAPAFTKQRFHVGPAGLDLSLVPDQPYILAGRVPEENPGAAVTDVDLDNEDVMAEEDIDDAPPHDDGDEPPGHMPGAEVVAKPSPRLRVAEEAGEDVVEENGVAEERF